MLRKLACLLLIVCAGSAWAQEYLVQPGDTLVLDVMEDPDMRRTVLVLPDGTVSVPLAGTMKAAGLTVPQIEAMILEGIGQNYVNAPTVMVSVSRLAKPQTPRSRSGSRARASSRAPAGIDIYAMGEVGKPGKMRVARGTTVMQLLAEAGGFTRFAAPKRVILQRADMKTKTIKSYRINTKAMMEGGSQMIVLQPGDVIVVPERKLFE